MRKMSKDSQKAYIAGKTQERKKIQEEINKLSKERNKYVSEKRKEQASADVSTVDDALTSAIRKQGLNKKYEFEAK
jgi:hypothetical protein